MKHKGSPFADEISIKLHDEHGVEGFHAFAKGELFWKSSFEQCSNEDTARNLASEAYGHLTLLSDINDVLIWLSDENPNYIGELFVDRYRYHRWSKTIAYVVIYHDDPVYREHLIRRAEAAFSAIGWMFDTTGNADQESFGSCSVSDISAHRRISAIGRVRKAMRSSQIKDRTSLEKPF
jgi:hypothetical protein